MDTKKLSILLATIQAGSLKKAAEKLNYTQSGLIYLVNSLEEEIGLRLLKRNSKGVTLTEAGKALEPMIREIVERESKLNDKIAEICQGGDNKLRIGAYPIYACYCLPAVVKKFRANHPGIEFTIHVGVAEDIEKWLVEDTIDMGITEADGKNADRWTYLFDDETYVAVPANYPFSEEEPITLDELKDYPVLYSVYNPACTAIERLGGSQQLNKITISSTDGSAQLCMVEQGLGVAFLSSLYINECPPTVRMIPLSPPVIRPLGIVVNPQVRTSGLIREFITHLKAAMA